MSVSKKFKIADNSIDVGKLTARVVDQLLPLGTILDWYPVNAPALTAPNWGVPTGYAICDGEAWTNIDNNMGANGAKLTTGNIPNLIGKVTVGAQTNLSLLTAGTHNPSTNAQTNPGVNGLVGAGSNAVAGHSHSIPDHTHNLSSHTHGGPNHRHSVSYKSVDVVYLVTANASAGVSQYTTGVSVVQDANTGFEGTGSTGGPSSNASNGMNGRVSGGGSTGTETTGQNSNANTYLENRPASVGVLKIMKVKFS